MLAPVVPKDARRVAAELAEAGTIPVFCGGTGMYFKALIRGLSDIPAVPDAVRAQVVVGPRSALASRVIDLHSVNWLASADAPFDCAVKVRSMRPPVAARVTPLGGNRARVELASAEEAVAPGQACVFYSTGDSVGQGRVLGGGWIGFSDNPPLSATRASALADISPL